MSGFIAQLAACLTADPWMVESQLGHINFLEIDHVVISAFISPFCWFKKDSHQLVLVNHLEDYSKCPKILNTSFHTFFCPNYAFYIVISLNTSVAQLDAPSDWRPGGRGFKPRRGWQHSFVEIDREIFSTVIHSLPLIQERQLSVSGKRMCTILVNTLRGLSLPSKCVVR